MHEWFKNFRKHLPEPDWELYKNTYADCNYNNMWNALFAAGDLFRILASNLAQKLAYSYPYDDDRKMTEYLKHVRGMPIDAAEIH
ncbi:MAG: aminoglycoside adenylyltransferase [Paenibacillus sp.]|jgi:aminoglycoside 6-adenylyltransferase|uniref:aminoglycoside 6-adenylyltransferase n=1 Tax=Paenibacillus sp. GCM10012303 TaxID=3317340 RepID=UPI0029E96003|nr:aminoglycoside adenylyltransferase [Paenibacillus sp.]